MSIHYDLTIHEFWTFILTDYSRYFINIYDILNNHYDVDYLWHFIGIETMYEYYNSSDFMNIQICKIWLVLCVYAYPVFMRVQNMFGKLFFETCSPSVK